MLRKALIWLRKEHNENLKNHLLLFGLIAVILGVGSILIDIYLPFKGVGNIIRSIILLPLAASIFVLGYNYGLTLHYQRVNDPDLEWVPFRLRYSVSWRRKIAVVVFAFLFVFMYALTPKAGYTLSSSLFVAMLIALVMFIRPTKEEQMREELDIPDVRDIQFKKAQKEAAKRRVEEAQRRKTRRGRGRPDVERSSRKDIVFTRKEQDEETENE